MKDSKAREKFLQWVALEHPALYASGFKSAWRTGESRTGVGDLGFFDIVTGVVGAAGSYFAQKKAKKEAAKAQRQGKIDAAHARAQDSKIAQEQALFRQNATRASSGLAPVDASGAPARLTSYLPYALIGGAVLVLVMLKKKRG